MADSVDVRTGLVETLRCDLIGPGPDDADLCDERLKENPWRWYLADISRLPRMARPRRAEETEDEGDPLVGEDEGTSHLALGGRARATLRPLRYRCRVVLLVLLGDQPAAHRACPCRSRRVRLPCASGTELLRQILHIARYGIPIFFGLKVGRLARPNLEGAVKPAAPPTLQPFYITCSFLWLTEDAYSWGLPNRDLKTTRGASPLRAANYRS